MARVPIVIKRKGGSGGSALLDLLKSGLTAGDPTADHSWVLQNGDELYAVNTHATLARTVQVVQSTNHRGRPAVGAGQATQLVLAAGEAGVFGPLQSNGWTQADGSVNVDLIDGAAGDVKLAVLRA